MKNGKIIAIVLGILLVAGAVVGTVAKDSILFAVSPEAYIYKLVDNTFDGVKMYDEDAIKAVYGFEPTEEDQTVLYDIKLNSITADGETLDLGGFGMSGKYALSFVKNLFAMDFDFTYGDESAEYMQYMHSDDEIALSILGGEYITLNAKDILADWNNSKLAQETGSLKLPEGILDLSFGKLFEADYKLELPEKLSKNLEKATIDFIGDCEISKRENSTITVDGEEMSVKKVTVNISPEAFGDYLISLVDIVMYDEEIKEVVKNIYEFVAANEAQGDTEYYNELTTEFEQMYEAWTGDLKAAIADTFISEELENVNFLLDFYEKDSKLLCFAFAIADGEDTVEIRIEPDSNGIKILIYQNDVGIMQVIFGYDFNITPDKIEMYMDISAGTAAIEPIKLDYDIVYDFGNEKLNIDYVFDVYGESIEYSVDGTCSNSENLVLTIDSIAMTTPDGDMEIDCDARIEAFRGADFDSFEEKEKVSFKDMSSLDFEEYFTEGSARLESVMNAFSEHIMEYYMNNYDFYDEYSYDDEYYYDDGYDFYDYESLYGGDEDFFAEYPDYYDDAYFEDFYGEYYNDI